MGTPVEGGATTWGIREYRTRSPLLPLAFAHDTLQHRRAFSVVQSIDVRPRGRTIPSVGAGIVVHRTSSRECIISSRRGFAACARRLTKDTAPVATGGLRVYFDRHAFVSGNAGIRVGRAPTEGFEGHWQLGGGVSF